MPKLPVEIEYKTTLDDPVDWFRGELDAERIAIVSVPGLVRITIHQADGRYIVMEAKTIRKANNPFGLTFKISKPVSPQTEEIPHAL